MGGAWLDSICGNSPFLRNRYPRMRNGKPVEGFVADRARYDLMCACHEMGHWEPTNIRSVGAWLGAEGDLILHRGDHLFINGQVRPLGRVGEFVYIPGPPLPALPKVTKKMRPAEELLDRLETFGLARGSFDARMLLGAVSDRSRASPRAELFWGIWRSGSGRRSRSNCRYPARRGYKPAVVEGYFADAMPDDNEEGTRKACRRPFCSERS
jgi:hypothetical protein